tara:strand:- start:2255 stop:2521 length:267 start_codon:yes stop_codon:yes gene_type:complete
MSSSLDRFIKTRGSEPLFKKMNGWYLASLSQTISIGIVPERKKPCLYIVDEVGKEVSVLAVFSNNESAVKARQILNRLAAGLEYGKFK